MCDKGDKCNSKIGVAKQQWSVMSSVHQRVASTQCHWSMPRPWSTYNVDVAVDATIATADPTLVKYTYPKILTL